MSLGEACSLLEVNETTLRQWADSGRIRAYRTPGGHRRFSAEAVRSIIARSSEPAVNGKEPRWTDTAIQRVRRRLRSSQTSSQHWYQSMDDDTRSRMRFLGRKLLSIAADYSTQHRMRADLIEEARLIGEEYGAEMTRQGTSLRDALEAFVFFRTFLLENVIGGGYGASWGACTAVALREPARGPDAAVDGLLLRLQAIDQFRAANQGDIMASKVEMDLTDRQLLNIIQTGFPLTEEPFACLGEQLEISESEAIERTGKLKKVNIVRQISAIFDTRRLGYKTTLVAMRFPPDSLDKSAQAHQ